MRMTGWRVAGVLAAGLALSACGGDLLGGADRIGGPVQRQALPPADYLTQSDQFAALQSAALAADYENFAFHLRASDPQAVVRQLRDAFAGGPFDVVTIQARTNSRDHRRVAELRGPTDRLYLYIELDQSAGGWNVARYDLSRSRDTTLGRL